MGLSWEVSGCSSRVRWLEDSRSFLDQRKGVVKDGGVERISAQSSREGGFDQGCGTSYLKLRNVNP